MSYGTAIHILRSLRGMRQGGLADAAGLDPTYISRIESGDRRTVPARTLRKIAAALDVDPHTLTVLAYPEDFDTMPGEMRATVAEKLLAMYLDTARKEPTP